MHKNGVKHKTSAPLKPSSNGQAERYVATLKQSLRAMHKYEDRKFDVGDRVAVRVYRAAYTRWKFGTIVNQDGVLHYIIDVQGTLQRFEKTTLIFSMPKWRKIGSSSVQGVPSTDVAVPDLSQSLAKETDSETRTRPVPDRPFY
ncbi:transposon Tf2-6 polyprotein [Trichonephila clavipes]|nr:transposon Tf2-6 polyprotein [Trichonephila clavipes]